MAERKRAVKQRRNPGAQRGEVVRQRPAIDRYRHDVGAARFLANLAFQVTLFYGETVLELRGGKIRVQIEPDIQLGLPAYIPEAYIPDVNQRLVFYKKMANVESRADLEDLAKGVCGVLKFLEAKGVAAFNLSWYFAFKSPVSGMRNWVSIVPRVNFPLLDTSDVNYFDRLHGESVTFVAPEDVTKEIRGYF